MVERYVYLVFQIDTNRINSKQRLESMNQLEQWHRNGVIRFEMSEPSLGEILSEGDAKRTRKAAEYIYSLTEATTESEAKQRKRIADILFPNGVRNRNQQNDVDIVFNAAKYGRIRVTNDGGSKSQPGGILGNADKLKSEFGVRVVTDAEAVSIVRSAIDQRDTRAKFIAERRGEGLPDWVESD
jgi:hypothetical protein